MDLVGLASYMFVMSITPGPNNVMLTASGASFGMRRTLPHLLGVSGGYAVQVFLVCLGAGALFEKVPELHRWMAWAGVGYLIYMAVRILGASTDERRTAGARPLTFLEAAVFQFVNPKAVLMTTTAAAIFLPHSSSGLSASLVMAFVSMAVNLPCVAVWAAFGSILSSRLRDPATKKTFQICMAVLLFVSALPMLKST